MRIPSQISIQGENAFEFTSRKQNIADKRATKIPFHHEPNTGQAVGGSVGNAIQEKVQKLLVGLKSTDGRIQANASCALLFIGSEAKDAVPVLIDALKDEHIRCFVVLALSNIGPEAKDAIPALLDALENSGKNIVPILVDALINS